MRIAFDGRVIKGRKCGTGVYAEGLLNALMSVDRDNLYMVFTNDAPDSRTKNVKSVTTKFSIENHPLGDIWEQFYLPLYLNGKKIDVIHSPTFHIPFLGNGIKKIVTIHDMVSYLYPKTQPMPFVMYSKFMIKSAINSAHGIVVSSETAKEQIVDHFKAPPELFHVIHGAPRDIFKPVGRAVKDFIKDKYALPDQFILFVGSIEPRKNIRSLVKAYSELKRSNQISHKLVICGTKGWLNEYEKVLETIEETGVRNDVIFTGYVPDEDLPGFYGLADLFVYPSLYEGFGLPPLEAMACGCPVIASNYSSIPEVVGEGGVLIDPFDIDELALAILKVSQDDGLKSRLKEAGIKRALQFSWERSARSTIEMYMNIARN